jgi:hypothetical protein
MIEHRNEKFIWLLLDQYSHKRMRKYGVRGCGSLRLMKVWNHGLSCTTDGKGASLILKSLPNYDTQRTELTHCCKDECPSSEDISDLIRHKIVKPSKLMKIQRWTHYGVCTETCLTPWNVCFNGTHGTTQMIRTSPWIHGCYVSYSVSARCSNTIFN